MKKSDSFKTMTFFVFTSLGQTELPPKYFSALAAMYHQIVDIRILEAIRWGMAKKSVETLPQGPFPLRAWKRAFFVSFIDLRLKRAVKIEASAKKSIKQRKNAFFHARSGNGP